MAQQPAKTDQDSGKAARRTRRQLLAGGTGALAAVLTAETLARPAPASAANGDFVVLGQSNSSTAITSIDCTGDGATALAATATGLAGIGVQGFSGGEDGDGVLGIATGTFGHGVVGNGSFEGVLGVSNTGTGVVATGKTALRVNGPAVFSRSGTLTVQAGRSAATQGGVALTSSSLVLVTLQQDRAGVWVRSAVPDVLHKSFTVHLSKAVPASTKVAWFIVN